MHTISDIVKSTAARNLLAVMFLAVISFMNSAPAYSDEMYNLKVLCETGDRKACHKYNYIRLDRMCHAGDSHACREFDLFRQHEACERGDRGACVRFGIILGEDRVRRDEWRRMYPEFFWWER